MPRMEEQTDVFSLPARIRVRAVFDLSSEPVRGDPRIGVHERLNVIRARQKLARRACPDGLAGYAARIFREIEIRADRIKRRRRAELEAAFSVAEADDVFSRVLRIERKQSVVSRPELFLSRLCHGVGVNRRADTA